MFSPRQPDIGLGITNSIPLLLGRGDMIRDWSERQPVSTCAHIDSNLNSVIEILKRP